MAAKENMKTATTLTHVAALLQIIFTIIGFLAVLGLTLGTLGLGIFFGAIGVIGVIIGTFWAWVDYEVIYERMREGKFAKVSDTMLIAGIVQLFIGGTIPGIIILVAWFVARS